MTVPFGIIYQVAKTVISRAQAEKGENDIVNEALDLAEDLMVGVFPAAERVIQVARKLAPLALEKLGMPADDKLEFQQAVRQWDAAISELMGEIQRAKAMVEEMGDEEMQAYGKDQGWIT